MCNTAPLFSTRISLNCSVMSGSEKKIANQSLNSGLFRVSGAIGQEKIKAYVKIDKRNYSIHIHLYGKSFGSKRTPISVKKAAIKFPEDNDDNLVKEVLTSKFLDHKVIVSRIIKIRAMDKTTEQNHPHRIIVRFKK